MKIKLKILNMKNFLQTVNRCHDTVNMLYPDGTSKNINKQKQFQDDLLQKFLKNKKCLHLSLNIANPSDYMRIVSYYAGDC